MTLQAFEFAAIITIFKGILAMTRFSPIQRGGALAVALSFGLVAAQPALAQSQPGPYGVARAGVQLDADLKGPKPATNNNPKAPTPTPTTTGVLPRDIDAKPGFTGELGMGYDFGGFRLEGTVGYSNAALNADRLTDRTLTGSGRMRSLDLGVAGYVDFNPAGQFKPFIGAGIGASRVDLRATRLALPATGRTPAVVAAAAGTRISDRDWGFRWHLDAGAGYALTPTTTLELAGRYTRTSGLDFTSQTRATAGATPVTQIYKPRASSTSLMLGLRQKF
jgi:opacity protein-like surface antigen